MKRTITFILVMLATLAILTTGCGGKSKYRISQPQKPVINDSKLISKLGDDKTESIQEFLPMIIDWYNDTDINNPVSTDHFSENFYDKALEIVNTTDVNEETKPITEIMWIIARITMTSDISTSNSSEKDSSTRIFVREADWAELGEKIKYAVSFYFDETVSLQVPSKNKTTSSKKQVLKKVYLGMTKDQVKKHFEKDFIPSDGGEYYDESDGEITLYAEESGAIKYYNLPEDTIYVTFEFDEGDILHAIDIWAVGDYSSIDEWAKCLGYDRIHMSQKTGLKIAYSKISDDIYALFYYDDSMNGKPSCSEYICSKEEAMQRGGVHISE